VGDDEQSSVGVAIGVKGCERNQPEISEEVTDMQSGGGAVGLSVGMMRRGRADRCLWMNDVMKTEKEAVHEWEVVCSSSPKLSVNIW
jgi:hypothetical protein